MRIARGLGVLCAVVSLAATAACSGERDDVSTKKSDQKVVQDAAGACAGVGDKYPSLKGKAINVGSNPGLNYYDFIDANDPSKVIGLEPDLISAVAKCAGFTYKYQQIDFNGLVPALKSKRIDAITSGMYATPERAKEVSFVSYMKAAEAAVVKKDNPKGITGLDKLCGVTMAQVVGTVEVQIAEKEDKKCKAAGKPPIKFLNFANNNQLTSALTTNRADVFLTDAGVAAYIAKKFPGLGKGFDIVSDFVFGIGVNKDNKDLLNAVNDSLAALHEKGELTKIAEQWGFSKDQVIKPALVTG